MKLARSLRPFVGAFFAPLLAAATLVMAFLSIAVNNAAASMGFPTVTVALGATGLANLNGGANTTGLTNTGALPVNSRTAAVNAAAGMGLMPLPVAV